MKSCMRSLLEPIAGHQETRNFLASATRALPLPDNDSGILQQSTSERIAAPRYSATAIDLARLILSRREPEVRAYRS
jgi:hypothetical protein